MNGLEDLLEEMGLTTSEVPIQNSDLCRASLAISLCPTLFREPLSCPESEIRDV